MSDNGLIKMAEEIVSNVLNDVLTSAGQMEGTIVAAAAFGGFCLFLYKLVEYYSDFNVEIISKEHFLAIILILIGLILLPLLGVAFVGLYGITNGIAAWQIGLTTPLIIESVYITYAKKAKAGKYHDTFIPADESA